MLNVFNRNTIRKQRPGHLFVCRRKTEANAPASSQERTNAFYVIVSAIGVFRWSRYRIRPECIADLRYSVKLIEREGVRWSGRRDSNPRPSAPKADALPDCATPRRFSDCIAERLASDTFEPPVSMLNEPRKHPDYEHDGDGENKCHCARKADQKCPVLPRMAARLA